MKLFFRYILIALVLLTGLFLLVRERGIYTFWSANVERLNSVEGALYIEKNQPLIVDARSLEEFQVSHIKDAQLYHADLLKETDVTHPILIYCTIGVRSNSLAQELTDQGFEEVYELKRGILGWKNAEQEVFNLNGQLTDEIHVYSRFIGSFLNRGKAIYP